jgi:hypothetical protein
MKQEPNLPSTQPKAAAAQEYASPMGRHMRRSATLAVISSTCSINCAAAISAALRTPMK